jgi:hypothetical protein
MTMMIGNRNACSYSWETGEVCWHITDTGAANGTLNDRAVELQPGLKQEFGSVVGIHLRAAD